MPWEMSTVNTVLRRSRGKASALFPDDGDPAAVALQLARDLGDRCQWVVLGGYRSDAHARVEGDERLRAVRQRNRHRVPGTYPGLVQDARSAQHLVANLRVGRRGTEIIERHAIRVQAGGGVEQLVEGCVRHGHLIGHCVVEVVCLADDTPCHDILL